MTAHWIVAAIVGLMPWMVLFAVYLWVRAQPARTPPPRRTATVTVTVTIHTPMEDIPEETIRELRRQLRELQQQPR